MKNIAGAFCEVDKAGCATYTANSQAYIAKLAALNEKVKTEIAAIPPEKRNIITSHDAFGYFEHAYGLEFTAPEGISTDSKRLPPTSPSWWIRSSTTRPRRSSSKTSPTSG